MSENFDSIYFAKEKYLFNEQIEPALRDCQQNGNGITCIGSQSGDLELKVSLKYSRRDGTFKRQGSKRSLAVFGKSIEKLIAMPNGVYV